MGEKKVKPQQLEVAGVVLLVLTSIMHCMEAWNSVNVIILILGTHSIPHSPTPIYT